MPDAVAAILDRMLAKDPADRFATPADVAEAIEPWCACADLPALLQRALETQRSPLPPGEGQGEGVALQPAPSSNTPPLQWGGSRRRSIVLLCLLLLMTGGIGFALGILVTIKRDGRETTIDIPAGSAVAIDESGNPTVSIPSEKDGKARGLVSTTMLDSLDAKGADELVSVLFPLSKAVPKEVLAKVGRFLGPHGSYTHTWRQLTVIDEASRVRQVRDLLRQMGMLEESASRIDADGQVEVTLPGHTKPVEQAPQPKEPPLQFGPVIERVVNAVGEGKGGEGFDLVSGKLVDVPKEFNQWSAQQQGKWSAENNVDLLVDFLNDASTGIGGGMSGMPAGRPALLPEGLKLAAIAGERWDNATAKDLQSALASITPERLYSKPGGMYFVIANVRERRGVTYYEITFEVPLTFAFQTRKGDLGILQVIRYTEEPRGMRIRYKLVQTATAASRTAPDETAIEGTWEVVSSTFGLLKKLTGRQDVAPEDVLKTTKVVVTANTLKIVGQYVTDMAFDYRLNPAAKMKMIDLQTPGTTFGLVSYGIYQFEGDQLKICASGLRSLGVELDRPDAKLLRPAEFWAELGSDKELLVLRRVGDALVTEDEKAILGTWQVEEAPEAAASLGFVPNRKFVFSRHGISTQFTIEHEGGAIAKDGTGGRIEHFEMTLGYALDPTAKPKRIDLATIESPPVEPCHGVYELEGGRLTVAWSVSPRRGEPDAGPPSKIAAGPNVMLVVLKRVAEPTEKVPLPENAPEKPAQFLPVP